MLIVWIAIAYLAGLMTVAVLLGLAAVWSAGIDSNRGNWPE
jgi:hypothetical protein